MNPQQRLCDNEAVPVPSSVSKIMQHAIDSSVSPSISVCSTADSSANIVNDAFKIDMDAIATVPKEEQGDELLDLGITVYDQTKLEEEVMAQVESAFRKKEEEMKINQAKKDLKEVFEELRLVRQRLGQTEKALTMAPKSNLSKEARRKVEAIKREQENTKKQLKKLEAKRKSLCIILGEESEAGSSSHVSEPCELDQETEFDLAQVFSQQSHQDHLISTGEMTPFGTMLPKSDSSKPSPKSHKIVAIKNELTDFEKFLLQNGAKSNSNIPVNKTSTKVKKNNVPGVITKNKNLNLPSTSATLCSQPSTSKEFPILKLKSNKKKKVLLGSKHATGIIKRKRSYTSLNTNFTSDHEMSDFENGDVNYDKNDFDKENDRSGSEYLPEESSEYDSDTIAKKTPRLSGAHDVDDGDVPWVSVKKEKKESGQKEQALKKKSHFKRVHDDGNEKIYLRRLRAYRLQQMMEKEEKSRAGANNEDNNDKIIEEDEDEEAVEIDSGFKVPSKVWNKLFRYQQTCVRWLWELHQQNCGGIIGDEMGLGKTIQVIAFLSGLHFSGLRTYGDKFMGLGPVILVCPATVMHQWVKEFHKWWPPIRVAILHVSGSYSGSKESLVRYINRSKGVLVTSYAGVAHYQTTLHPYDWHYVILDEGHKIRNPDAQTTLACKQFRTSHRIILSGSPIQNNLKELWSLFDFVFPGKLATLPVFLQQFAVPITHGGYANASEVQVQTAYKCAVVLRETIKPYMLRRMKSDVQMSLQLPNKNEQVLFCQLTEEQRDMYKQYLDSSEIAEIIDGKFQIFVGLINLRKICNHPDIYSGGPKIFVNTDISTLKEEEHYGYHKRSGKMIVVESLLKLWKQQGHRVLLFTQSRQMLVILEQFLKSRDYRYMKMDGTTSIGSRQPAIHKFNTDPSIFIFLLTTRVGGLGVNLTGANRVIIYDPDWNPSTDLQARERAWRIGQDKQVTIYRLLTAGTIEEKIYHRQIFKQFLTNRVLKDPRQRRFFKSNDLHELFTLGSDDGKRTETSDIFAGTGSEIKLKQLKVQSRKKTKLPKFSFSPEKVEKMKEIAKKISMKMTTGEPNSKTDKTQERAEPEKPAKKGTEKKRKKRKKDKFKGIVFEGENISHLIGQGEYTQPNEEQNEAQQDDYILKKLLKKSAVKTALRHENIVNSADPDYLLVEGEAERVAKEAVQALKRSRRLCQKALAGVPTWTGTNGASGAPPAFKKRFGVKKNTKLVDSQQLSEPSTSSSKTLASKSGKNKTNVFDLQPSENDNTILSSSELIAKMKQRNSLVNTKASNEYHDSSDNGDDLEAAPTTEYDEMLCDIRNFVAFQSNVNGKATTAEVLEAFKDKVPVCGAPVFKALLAKICDFHRTPSGDGIWELKEDFK